MKGWVKISLIALGVVVGFFFLLIIIGRTSIFDSNTEDENISPENLEANQSNQKCLVPPEFNGTVEDPLVLSARNQNPAHFLKIKGVEFVDIFGRLGGPEFDINQENPECFPDVMEHVLNGPKRMNANLVGIVPAAFYKQISPTPKFADWGNDLSLTDDEYYAKLVKSFKDKGFMVMETEQPSLGFYTTDEENAMFDNLTKNPEWWDAWFTEWEAWLIPRAERAEANGVDIFNVELWTDSSFKPEVYPEYEQRWSDIVDHIRKVYSGKIAMMYGNQVSPLGKGIEDKFDVIVIGTFSGWQKDMTIDGKRIVSDPFNPTLNELTEAYERTLASSKNLVPKNKEIILWFGAVSADGQQASEDVEVIPTIKPDLQEQALYYEAAFSALQDEKWIDGVIVNRMDWFDEYKKTKENIYFDGTRSSSPRSKPAEKVLTYWYGKL